MENQAMEIANKEKQKKKKEKGTLTILKTVVLGKKKEIQVTGWNLEVLTPQLCFSAVNLGFW